MPERCRAAAAATPPMPPPIMPTVLIPTARYPFDARGRPRVPSAGSASVSLGVDLLLQHPQTVRQTIDLRGRLLSIEPRREGWSGGSQWRRKNDAFPHGGRRGIAR